MRAREHQDDLDRVGAGEESEALESLAARAADPEARRALLDLLRAAPARRRRRHLEGTVARLGGADLGGLAAELRLRHREIAAIESRLRRELGRVEPRPDLIAALGADLAFGRRNLRYFAESLIGRLLRLRDGAGA